MHNVITRCPCCRIVGDFSAPDGLDVWKGTHMQNPHGNRSYRTSEGSVERVRVRGLIYCKQCHIQWARDFSGSVNIGWVFVHAISTGSSERPEYLRTWWGGIFSKHKTYVAWSWDVALGVVCFRWADSPLRAFITWGLEAGWLLYAYTQMVRLGDSVWFLIIDRECIFRYLLLKVDS